MTINYKVIEKGQPGVTGGGKKKYYASPIVSKVNSLSDLTHLIEKRSTISGADIRGVLYALMEVMVESLEDGEIVRMGDIGSFRITLSSNGQENAEDFKSSCIKGSRIVFTPGSEVKDMLKGLTYKKKG